MSRVWHGIGARVICDCGQEVTRLGEHRRGELNHDGLAQAWGISRASEMAPLMSSWTVKLREAPLTEPSGLLFEAIFENSVAKLDSPDMSILVGGGVDSGAVAVAARRTWRNDFRLMTLRTGITSYDEVEHAQRLASNLSSPLDIVDTSLDEIVGLVPTAVSAMKSPLYGLHPISRLVIAKAARGLGIKGFLTGDGADALFRRVPDLDYVPHMVSLSEYEGLSTQSPFFDAVLVESFLSQRVRGKDVLRRYLREHGLEWLAGQKKKARTLPVLSVEQRKIDATLPLSPPTALAAQSLQVLLSQMGSSCVA